MTTRGAYEAKEATHWRTLERSLNRVVDALNTTRHQMRVIPVPIPANDREYETAYTLLVPYCMCGWIDQDTAEITEAYQAHLPRNTT